MDQARKKARERLTRYLQPRPESMNTPLNAFLMALAVMTSGVSFGAESNADAATSSPFRTSETRSLDYAESHFVRFDAPPAKNFCFPIGAGTLAREGFFVPLLSAKCEDIDAADGPPQVHITLHPNVMDDVWEANRTFCTLDPHDMKEAEMAFTDLGRVNGLRAQRCVSVYQASEHDPEGYYSDAVTLINGKGDASAGAHYRIVAAGSMQHREGLDALLAEVLKGVHPTPVLK